MVNEWAVQHLRQRQILTWKRKHVEDQLWSYAIKSCGYLEKRFPRVGQTSAKPISHVWCAWVVSISLVDWSSIIQRNEVSGCRWNAGESSYTTVTALCMCAQSLQSCLTLCDPMGSSPPGSSVRGILQPRILESAAVPSLGAFPTQRSSLRLLDCRQILHCWATGEAPITAVSQVLIY